jgi:hypothetical protein
MEPKRQRAIWSGAGILFVLAVGSGYIPDFMLRSEMAAAREEGLIQPAREAPFISSSKNAHLRYQEIESRYGAALAQLRAAPIGALSDPQVQKMLREYAEASKRPVYQELVPPPDARYGRPYPYGNVRSDIAFVGLILAREAKSADDLAAAARMANHLRSSDPAELPSPDWAKIAERVLDKASALNLRAEDRQAVGAALGPTPDLKGELRAHVVGVLQRLEKQSKSGEARRMTAEKVRFLRFWREFLRTVPTEPKAFAIAVAAAEPKIEQVDAGVGIYRDYSTSSPLPWKDWAEAMARVLPRLSG